MIGISHIHRVLVPSGENAATETTGSQIVEFAVALPLLLVVVVGIFDFGNAYNIKQRVTNVAREAARMGASQSTGDLTQPTPTSILEIRDMVSSALQSQQTQRLRARNYGSGAGRRGPLHGSGPSRLLVERPGTWC